MEIKYANKVFNSSSTQHQHLHLKIFTLKMTKGFPIYLFPNKKKTQEEFFQFFYPFSMTEIKETSKGTIVPRMYIMMIWIWILGTIKEV